MTKRASELIRCVSFSLTEEIVYDCYSTPGSQYSKTAEHECSVTDSEKRGVILVEDTMELHAVMLQGGAADRKGEILEYMNE